MPQVIFGNFAAGLIGSILADLVSGGVKSQGAIRQQSFASGGADASGASGDYARMLQENQQAQREMAIFQHLSQQMMQKFSTESTISKNGHDGAMTIIRNMKAA